MPEDSTASTPKSLEETYLNGRYADAVKQLLEAKDDYSTGQFHYNLGTLHAKLGDLPVARFHLEKAVRSGFTNTHGLHNLEYVREKLSVDDLSTSPRWGDQGLEIALNLGGGALWALSLLFLIAIAIAAKKSKWGYKRVFAVLVLLSLLPGAFSELYLKRVRLAVALKEGQIHEGPSAIYQSKSSLQAGSKFVVGQVKDGWSFIARPLSISGWVRNQDLGLF